MHGHQNPFFCLLYLRGYRILVVLINASPSFSAAHAISLHQLLGGAVAYSAKEPEKTLAF